MLQDESIVFKSSNFWIVVIVENTFLTEFAPVSVKLAVEFLSLASGTSSMEPAPESIDICSNVESVEVMEKIRTRSR